MKPSSDVGNTRKHLTTVVFLVALFVVSGLTRAVAPSPQLEWNRTYGGESSEIAYSLIRSSDGGYAIAGYTYSYGAGLYDFWLVKTDDAGNMQWNRTYGGESTDGAYSVVQTSDEGFALAGFTYSYGAGAYDSWLIKTDSSGSLLWNKTYGGINSDVAYSLIKTADGGYALAGYTYSFGMGLYDFWLVKTDSAGNAQWNRTYGGTRHDQAYSVVQTADGGYALAGYTKSIGAGDADFWLVKTDASGNVQWNKTYGGINPDSSYSVVQTSDSGYALAGYTNSYGAGSSDFWLVRTDSSGNMLWNRTYGGSNPDQAYSLIRSVGGGFALAGHTNSTGAGMYDFWLVQTDSSGNMVWNRPYGGMYSDIAFAIVQAGDGGFALAGHTNSYGAGSYDFWLVKLAAEVYHDVTVTDSQPSKTVVGQGYFLTINATVENQGNVDETFDVTVYCNDSAIGTQMVNNLQPSNFATLSFVWNTTDAFYGNYTIAARANPVPGETDTVDNSHTDGTVLITVPGDVSGDGLVGNDDLVLLSQTFGSQPLSSNADINNDREINILDLRILGANWERTTP